MAAEPTFVARQPILDAQQRVFGYELLFRESRWSEAFETGPEAATASVISNALLGVGLKTLTNGRRAFINVTRKLLLEGVPEVLAANRVVLELTEDIEPDAEVLRACGELRRAGYELALDDFVLTDRTAALIPHASFIKVDFLASDARARAEIAARCVAGRTHLIAEKIETLDAFHAARGEGYAYFQGFFFGRPVIKPGRALPGQQTQSLALLAALQDPNISAADIEELVKPDVRLCYLILRTVNSAGFSLRTSVHSIRDALVLIGHEAVRRWASLWVLAGLGQAGHQELLSMSATRGRCCELLDARAGRGEAGDGFLVGMCSLLDAILAAPMAEVVEHLALADSTRAARLGEDTCGRRQLDCVIAYDRGDWTTAMRLAPAAGISPRYLPEAHAEAWRWAHHLETLRATA